MRMSHRRLSVIVIGLLAVSAVLAQKAGDEYVFRATAKLYSIAGPRNVTAKVNLGIERWTTPEERTALLETIVAAGPGGGTAALGEAFGDAEKIVLTLGMWIGRLEIVTVLALLNMKVLRNLHWRRFKPDDA